MATAVMPLFELHLSDVRLHFGVVKALDGVTVAIRGGECVGLVGHNGAGKSTLINVINGALRPMEGTLQCDGTAMPEYSIQAARALGIRCVFQELSLCPNLSIIENTRVLHRQVRGIGWPRRAAALFGNSLDTVFPGHGLSLSGKVGNLSIAQRQMVEIAMAFCAPSPRLVILDEPTSSLDANLAAQLLAHVRRFTQAGGSVIFISHILQEVLSSCDRIVVMRDGRIVDERPSTAFSHHSLVEAMGSVAKSRDVAMRLAPAEEAPLALDEAGVMRPFSARKGEIIGFAGLAGHGQTEMLLALHALENSQWRPNTQARTSFVAGDRRLNGVFDLWSIVRNMSVSSLAALGRRGFVQPDKEMAAAAHWKQVFGVKTPDLQHSILSLSGGNQQKVLFARAFATAAPVVLMDDPMRGVDVGTKQDVYGMIRQEAENGRTFVWYSTETEEICLCDRVFVFRDGAIVAELVGADITENAILAASFKGEAA